MRRLTSAVCVAVLVVAASASLGAQWPSVKTPGVPRASTGEPDLNAPPPRTPDGKVDLSGLWRGAQAAPAGAAAAPPSPVPLATFRDVAANIKEGLPFRPEAAEVAKKRRADNSKDNPEAHCLPMGIMQFHTQGAPRKIVQTPGLLVILYEASMGIRQIHTDGRPFPKTEDAQPWWYGYSVGRWDGDTLVVETTGNRDEGWLDIFGTPTTDAAKFTERFRRVSYGRMEIDFTVDDPKAYTRPWTVRLNQQIMLDTDILEFVCLENQRFTQR